MVPKSSGTGTEELGMVPNPSVPVPDVPFVFAFILGL